MEIKLYPIFIVQIALLSSTNSQVSIYNSECYFGAEFSGLTRGVIFFEVKSCRIPGFIANSQLKDFFKLAHRFLPNIAISVVVISIIDNRTYNIH